MLLFDFLLAGLVIGGIYALISIGLNLQYGVARVLNLAYGEFLMLAGYGAFFAFTLIGTPPLLTLLVVRRWPSPPAGSCSATCCIPC